MHWPAPTTLKGVLQKALARRAASLRQHNIEVVRHYEDVLPAVHADALLLGQVSVNILTNAEQAIVAADRQGRIEVSAGRAAD
jgi:signal transduction histidine kinase